MAIAAAAFAPPPPMDPTDKQKYRTRLASAGTTPMNLHVSVGAHNLRILKKAASTETPRSGSTSAPAALATVLTPTSASKQRKYERKSKRFLWPDELHRLFVAAIFDIGLKNASPKALLSIMASAGGASDLTTEHLKSHLQKYRLNYERSRLEFLEFYDESARRSHKRRRKNSPRSSSSHDHSNSTAYVFPISHKTRQRSGSSDDDDDSDSNATSDMEVDEDESGASPTESLRTVAVAPPPPPGTKSDAVVKTESSRRRSAPSAAPAPSAERPASEPPTPAPVYAASSQGKPTTHATTTAATNNVVDGISDRMVAAAAAAAVASVPFGGLSTLSDPQWTILNSLISPQLTAEPTTGAASTSSSLSASALSSVAATGKLPAGFESFSLSGVESADLQTQMHLAMQAQMNLHRQMLDRKVAVSQHLHNQQQQQQQHEQQQATGTSAAIPVASAWSTSGASVPPQSNVLTDVPSSRLLGSMLTSESTNSTTAFDAFSQATPSAVESSVSTTLLGLQSTDFADAAALASLEAVGAATEKPDDNEALADLYRWDKMDFSMDLDDDDLFGFLKA